MIGKLVERNRDTWLLVARIFLGALFVFFGSQKILDFGGATNYLEYLGLPMPAALAVVAVAIEFLGGLALVLGWRVREVAVVMIVFVGAAACLGHPFWSMAAADRAVAQLQFFKNMSIIGGLLLLMVTGAGRFALSRA
ncbi:MAG: DoxX family protein [Xanthomonadales bacterium]|nr:DoxX family protein [Xanthomonadales bacterium]MCC6595557.1 DoxX family protein [Rhodanobacteraceae bacterium]MDL1868503.1 DoxX family protein [Gammaproteobacteria bacterium PRO6]